MKILMEHDEIRKRDRRAIDAINRGDLDADIIYEGAVRVLWGAVLVGAGVLAGAYLSTMRPQAATSASIPPRCEYVGAIPETPQEGAQPPTAVNEAAVATMPDAQMVERIGEPHEEWQSLGTWLLTAYCPCSKCNGSNAGRTASGAPMVVGRTVAVGGLPFGTKLKINDHIYVVEDRGVHGHHVDILHESHRAALDFGMQHAEVWVLK